MKFIHDKNKSHLVFISQNKIEKILEHVDKELISASSGSLGLVKNYE